MSLFFEANAKLLYSFKLASHENKENSFLEVSFLKYCIFYSLTFLLFWLGSPIKHDQFSMCDLYLNLLVSYLNYRTDYQYGIIVNGFINRLTLSNG